MAFGRSNSLSINTGSANSLFGNNATSNTQQQQPSNTLFGASNTTSQPQQSGGLFGSAAAPSQPQQSGGLFGSAPATSQPQQSTGLFGNTAAAQTPKPTGLFGAAPSSTQPQQSGAMFGATANNNTSAPGGLFGATANNNNNTPAPGGLFGAAQPNPGLFGVSKPVNNAGLFAQTPANNNNNNNNFGSSILNPLGASTAKPLAGSLTLGQGAAAPQNNVQPGVKIDLSNLRPTTRFSDLHDDLKKQIESIDSFIRQQESYCAQCESLVAGHSANVESVKPDVDLVQGKIETVELALENDGAAIENAKELVQRDARDLIRVARMSENLTLPQQYHYGRNARPSADDNYDIDLVSYFNQQAETMQKTLDTYTSHMAEIEAHLRVVEGGIIQQAQQLAAQRTGGRPENSADTVRELAETLRGFEGGILGAAGLVGSCREGVNELILGKVGGDPRQSFGHGGRRSVRF